MSKYEYLYPDPPDSDLYKVGEVVGENLLHLYVTENTLSFRAIVPGASYRQIPKKIPGLSVFDRPGNLSRSFYELVDRMCTGVYEGLYFRVSFADINQAAARVL